MGASSHVMSSEGAPEELQVEKTRDVTCVTHPVKLIL